MDINMANIVSDIGGFIGFVVVLLAISLGSERTTELAIQLLGLGKGSRFTKWFAIPSGVPSWLLSFVPAFLIAFGFEVNVLAQFEIFADIDPQFVQILSAMIYWGVSNIIHPEMPRANGGE